MTLSMKLGGAWKEAQSLHVKIAGEWKDVSTLYSKKDGAWVTVYSSGALIEFADYPFQIPVAQGWKYSTDGKVWTKVEADGEINTEGGMFTGFVKANEITLNDYTTEHILPDSGRKDGQELSVGRSGPGAFSNGGKGYVCGGYNNNPLSSIDVYDSSGNRTVGDPMSVGRNNMTSFVNAEKGYVCGGISGDSVSVVDVYDSSGNRTTGTSLSVARSMFTSFVNGNRGYVCGGFGGLTIVDIYDSSGTRTTGTELSEGRRELASFANADKGYVCGGYGSSGVSSVVDIYDISGIRTIGTSIGIARQYLTPFVNGNKGYVCGGDGKYDVSADVDIYDSSGNRTTGTSLSVARRNLKSFANGINGYVCGGLNVNSSTSPTAASSVVDVYDTFGNRTNGIEMSIGRYGLAAFVNDSKGYVCGGSDINNPSSVVDIYYDIPESYVTNLPITQGSVYTLNGESGTATESKVMEFDVPVTGTIKYSKGGLLTDVVLIDYVDYPFPIPIAAGWKYSVGGSDWNEVTVDGELNTEGELFTGSVWANSISLDGWYSEHIEAQDNAKISGKPLNVAKEAAGAFALNDRGYVYGGSTKSSIVATVDVFDKYGNVTSGQNLLYPRSNSTEFVNAGYAYVCGGSSSGYSYTYTDVFDGSGNVTSGTPLVSGRSDLTAFVNDNRGYVCGGFHRDSSTGDYGQASSNVDIYDESGNRSNSNISQSRYSLSSFVNGNRGYVCGGYRYDGSTQTYYTNVDVFDTSGNRTTGTSLSVGRRMMNTFANAGHGYVCGGETNDGGSKVVDIYDENGNKTESTTAKMFDSACFVNNNKGYICGGIMNYRPTDLVIVYDANGTYRSGPNLSCMRSEICSFVLDSKGYLCGGSDSDGSSSSRSKTVEIIYDILESFSAKLPVTAGSTYDLNGVQGTADTSKVMEFNSKVSGTINYAKGTIPVN